MSRPRTAAAMTTTRDDVLDQSLRSIAMKAENRSTRKVYQATFSAILSIGLTGRDTASRELQR